MAIYKCLYLASILMTTNGPALGQSDVEVKFSSSQLITNLRGSPGIAKADQTPVILYKQRHAEGYLAGVMDATEGVAWCRPSRGKPGELEEMVWVTLARSPNRNSHSAATDVVQTLRSIFPCPQRKP